MNMFKIMIVPCAVIGILFGGVRGCYNATQPYVKEKRDPYGFGKITEKVDKPTIIESRFVYGYKTSPAADIHDIAAIVVVQAPSNLKYQSHDLVKSEIYNLIKTEKEFKRPHWLKDRPLSGYLHEISNNDEIHNGQVFVRCVYVNPFMNKIERRERNRITLFNWLE